jgi:hypothetical protein
VVTAEMVEPRFCAAPACSSSRGREALEVADQLGVKLDPWQEFALERGLGVRDDGLWAALEVGVVCPRQNGKNGILEVLEFAGILAFGERLIMHSAHLADTSKEGFRRLEDLLEANEWLSTQVKHIWRTNGHEAIEFQSGQRIRFRTRTKGGGRGFSADRVIFDEAMILSEASLAAVFPTVSARPNPQVWYTGSAVDQMIHEDGVVLARIRERGLSEEDVSLAYFEWSAEPEGDEPLLVASRNYEMLENPETWARANPALGIRIAVEHVENELRSMDPRTFCVERLGIGDWPATDGSAATVIPVKRWQELADPGSQIVGPVAFAYDTAPDRSTTAIGVSGAREDGFLHLEVVDSRPGTRWVPARLAELVARHDAAGVICDAAGPAGSLIPEIEELGVAVEAVSATDHSRACGSFLDAVLEGQIRHLGTAELRAALRGAARRPLGDAWAWSRKNSAIDISPLVAVTLARWGASQLTGRTEPAFAWV